MSENCDVSWLHHLCCINHRLLFLSGVHVVFGFINVKLITLLCCKHNLEKMICQSGVGQERTNLTHWHRTLLLIVSLVTGSHMPAVMGAFGAARAHGVHLWQGTCIIPSRITKIRTRFTLTWKPAAGTIIS